MSHAVLEDVARLKVRHPDRVHFILGNHELAELTDYPIQKNRQMLNVLFRMGLRHMYGAASEMVRLAMLPFFQSCPLAVRTAQGIFISHSVPEFVDARPFDTSIFARRLESSDYTEHSEVFQLVWGRDYRQTNAQAFADLVDAKILINGHEPCIDGYCVPNDIQVIVDCCSDKACYAILPLDRPLDQLEVIRAIKKLE
jgi:hypothetical protein